MARLWLLLGLAFTCMAYGAPGFAGPVLVCEGCIGQMAPRLTARGVPIPVREKPEESSRTVAILTLPAGKVVDVEAKDIQIITRKAGIINVMAPDEFEGYSFGTAAFISQDSISKATPQKYSLNPGDTMQELHRSKQGACFLKIGKETVLRRDCNWDADSAGTRYQRESLPEIEWWIRMGPGWVRLNGSDPPFDLHYSE